MTAIVLMTYGEAHEPIQDIVEAARPAREAGIAVVTVGFGTTAGTTIPLRQDGTETLKRDMNGEIVVTRYHPEVLRAIAEATGGTFIDAAETDKAGRVRRARAALHATRRATIAARDRRARFQLFLAPAFVLVLLDALLADRRGRRRTRAAAAAVTANAA